MLLGIVSNPPKEPQSERALLVKLIELVERIHRDAKMIQAPMHRRPAMLGMANEEIAGNIERKSEKVLELLDGFLAQLDRGVHVNGRQGKRRKMSDDVQAIIYRHIEDGKFYCHGFADAEIDLKTHRDGSLTIRGLADETDVRMFAEPDGTVTVEGAHGQRLWEDMD